MSHTSRFLDTHPDALGKPFPEPREDATGFSPMTCRWCDQPVSNGTAFCAEHIGEARLKAMRELAQQDQEEPDFV